MKYFLTSGGRNGHSIHSPFVYELVRKVIYNREMDAEPTTALSYHKQLLQRKDLLEIEDHGAGSRVSGSKNRSISSMVKRSSVNIKQGEVLFRLCRWYRPEKVFEFGTGLGISTAYIAEGAENVPIVSIEGSIEKHKVSRELLQHGFQPDLRTGLFDDFIDELVNRASSHMIVFLDGDHRYEPTVSFADRFLEAEGMEEMIIVLDDIYWSDGMEAAWKELCKRESVSISIDLFRMGLLIKRPGIEKQHFKIKF